MLPHPEPIPGAWTLGKEGCLGYPGAEDRPPGPSGAEERPPGLSRAEEKLPGISEPTLKPVASVIFFSKET